MAKPLTVDARGEVGFWLTTERLNRDWSVEAMLAHLHGAGIALAPSQYREFESGTRRPQPERLEELERALGSKPSAATAASDGAVAAALKALAAAQDRQTAVLQEIVGELRALRGEGFGEASRPSPEWVASVSVAVARALELERGGTGASTPRQ